MTAAVGVLTGLAKLKRQDSARSQHRSLQQIPSPGLGSPALEAIPRKRKRRSDVVVVRGRLRLYSASGFFLLLGLVILVTGIGMAMLGYWPHGETTPVSETPTGAAEAPKPTGDTIYTSDEAGGAKTAITEEEVPMEANSSTSKVQGPKSSVQVGGALSRFLEQHRHSERMKMLGPFTMGIGIFIFICANAILHENRDRETKVIHMRDMYSTVIDIHRLRQRERKQRLHNGSFFGGSFPGGEENLGPERPAGHALLSLSRAGSAMARRSTEEEEEIEEELEELLGQGEIQRHRDGGLGGFMERPFGGGGVGGGRGGLEQARRHWPLDQERERGAHRARSIVSSSLSAFTLPVIKLNNCVIDEPEMEAITEEDRGGGGGGERRDGGGRGNRPLPLGSVEALVVPVVTVAKAAKSPCGLHRSKSATSSSHCSPLSSSSSLSPAPSSVSGCWLSPGAARDDFGSNASLRVLSSHSKSLDLERRPSMLSVRPEQRKHPSWPRLDNGGNRGNSKGYVRLEDREEGQAERLPMDGEAPVASARDYSKREKLLMISKSHSNLSFERSEFSSSSALKRGSSETRF